MALRSVLFDWRGTLVVSPTLESWVGEALRRLGRPAEPATVDGIAARLEQAGDRLDAPGMDADAALHSRIHLDVLADLGLDAELVHALYEVESDPACRSPIPRCSPVTLDALGIAPSQALMVGDRSRPDGAAVELGIPTLLLPRLVEADERRLHHVVRLCGAEETGISHRR